MRITGEDLRTTELLLVERGILEGDPWSGHMALPGGRRELRDASLLDTAVRETAEETAVDLSEHATLLGRLPFVAPRTPELPPLTVVPFVFRLEAPVYPVPRAGEIADVLWTSTAHLEKASTRSIHRHRDPAGESFAFPAFDVDGRTVWGLTHRILQDLLARME